jgi:transcriptional regulator with XRE-family HTH domain
MLSAVARVRTYSPYVREACRLLGLQIATGRRERRWSQVELAERAGVSPPTVVKMERGDPSVGLGVALEAAALVGVPLFHEERSRLAADVRAVDERLALLPRRVRRSPKPVNDDF